MVVTRLEHTETRFILQIRHLNLLLQLDMFLLALVKLHDLDSLLLHQTSFLDVELFLRLREKEVKEEREEEEEEVEQEISNLGKSVSFGAKREEICQLDIVKR